MRYDHHFHIFCTKKSLPSSTHSPRCEPVQDDCKTNEEYDPQVQREELPNGVGVLGMAGGSESAV